MDDSEKISAVSEQPETPAPAMKSASAHRVWLIDEGHAGHRVQSEGILNALRSSGLARDVTGINCTPTLRAFLRPAARAIFPHIKGASAPTFAKAIARFQVPDTGPPKFIISNGGRTALVSRGLASWSGPTGSAS